ncbi:uncharacterized protein LOC129343888 [Eublepharis macularius]|uniref:Uncharacterized protein LOC129343888 n=1 Tax=Eublepharis macularius TaxID=481883 RepID=A0AA97LLE3_EUBMA|nr:uncharacterized protein LOC129343888 [Eublepharis macularius]
MSGSIPSAVLSAITPRSRSATVRRQSSKILVHQGWGGKRNAAASATKHFTTYQLNKSHGTDFGAGCRESEGVALRRYSRFHIFWQVWDNSVLAAEERRGIPKAPEERDVKAKSVGIRGPLICYTANQANATLDLIIKSGGRPANDLLTLKSEVYLKITFEASGNYLIVKLSLDSPDDLLISSPVAGTNVNRYIQWSEAMVRKTLNALNRMYQDQVPTLRTKQHMNNTAVADSQGMLHIHVID